MNSLLLDSTTPTLQYLLQVEQQISQRDNSNNNAEMALIIIHQLLQQANLQLSQLNYLGYVKGPGSFVSTRITIAIVQALALVNNFPTVGLSSLQILAQMIYLQTKAPQVIVAIDARNNEVYFAHYQLIGKTWQVQPLGSLTGEETLLSYQQFFSLLTKEKLMCGLLIDSTQQQKLQQHGLLLSEQQNLHLYQQLDLLAAQQLFVQAIEQQQFTPLLEIDANYVRNNVATPKASNQLNNNP